ncbi:G-patch domain and KOW motifs-containing protein [Eurosta solidaginis]|uniref:G-patch domain and KOW motifs-containing protein n=1 Tax=Eurosta solidaginis TaxID=178769 RepID=UPI00353074FE
MEESKKISFGFSKTTKKPSLLPTNRKKDTEVAKVELIKCLEGQEIKLLEEKPEESPLIIPLKENTKTSAAIASLIKRRAVLLGEADDPPPDETTNDVNAITANHKDNINESLEERAAREILAALKGKDSESVDQNIIVPPKNADEIPLEGAKQSSIDDYENVPIEQFGRAMLRGMGWVDPIQRKGLPPAEELPFLRPRGMGLGADKALKKQPLLIAPEKNEVLEIKKLAYVRILGGKHKDMYGQIEGFDDHAGRVIVKLAIGGGKEAFNEFLCQPISKKEYAQYGKCINSAKYEEYKKLENEHGQIIIKTENVKKEYLIKRDGESESEYKRKGPIDKSMKNERGTHADNGSERQPSDYHSGSRRHSPENKNTIRRAHNSKSSRYYESGKVHNSSSRRECDYEHRNDNLGSNRIMLGAPSKRQEHEQHTPSASGSSNRRQQFSDDTSTSSDIHSDSDSAYERKHKKKSNYKSKAKKKSTKHAKRRYRHRKTETTDDSSNGDSVEWEESYRRTKKQHKKKTKKSTKPRSRSRTHERSNKM